PPRADGSADTSAIYAVAKTVAQHVSGYTLVVQKSTAPVGTARDLHAWMKRHARRGAEFDVASNPEFLREGSAIETFMRPDRVVKGLGMDRRIGSKFLHAGPGYGGSCFPKDTHALASFARAAGERVGIVEAAIEANERQMARMVDKVWDAIGSPRGKKVAVLGL